MVEIDFKNQAAFDAYNKKHKMRKSTKVNIGGKETTAGDAEGGGAKGAPKPGSSASPDDVMNATLGGEKIGDIIDNEDHPNYDKAMDYVSSFDPDDEKVVSGPGKGGGIKGPKPGDDWNQDSVMSATIGDNKVGDILGNEDHPDYSKALKYIMQFDPDDEKVVSGPGKGGDKESGPDLSKYSYDELGNAMNNLGNEAVKLDKHLETAMDNVKEYGPDEENFYGEKYGDVLKKVNADFEKNEKLQNQVMAQMDKLRNANESVNESVSRKRTTVKEIKTWMKTLEENRYKKTYNSDCRRVAWLVNNNLSEDYESMPISMRKKWSKAAYGRERQLAKEFLKSKRNETKLKESIRGIVKGLITEATTYKGVFDYNPKDPHKAGRSFEDMFDGADYGYSESWDTYGWNDQNNHDKAVEEYHKEMFKIVDGYVAANKKAQSFWKTKDKIFKKWRKTDGSKSGD